MDHGNGLAAYIPIDRQHALAQELTLPDRTQGTALFADISGFTPFSEALARELGPQLGAEQLTEHLNRVYGAIIAEVHQFQGSVVGFSGDAITCWFDQDAGERALTSALAIQAVMEQFETITTPSGQQFSLGIKVALASGPVRRFMVGSPETQRMDVLAGRLLDELAALEHMAESKEILASEQVVAGLESRAQVSEWRTEESSGQKAAVLNGINPPAAPSAWPNTGGLDREKIQAWLLPGVLERLQRSPNAFLAELRPVTALFLSFSGIDYEEDEDAGLLLDAYIRHAQKTIGQYEGALTQLTIGDKGSYLFATFGAPVAHDDDTLRALETAQKLMALPANLSFIQEICIGLAHGLVYTGAYGAPDRRVYGVQGDKANLAARLMQQAQPSEILCDEEVYRLARGRWFFDALPAVRVKGKAGLIRVYRARGKTTAARVEEDSTLIGRSAEVALLETALDEIQQGQGRLLFIEGEAGIGKSRLVAEMVRLMRERSITGLLGAGQSTEQHTTYRAWRDIFNSYFDIEAVTDARHRLEKVQRVIQEVAPKMIQRLPLLNEVLSLEAPDTPVTAALDPALRQESLTGLLVNLLRAWSQERPLVLVLEDAHWLDSLSWKLAEQVGRTLLAAGEPLLLVVVTRPVDEHSPGAQSLFALRSLPGNQTLSLANLEPGEILALVTAQLGLPSGGLPEAVAELVTARSEGNPFFAEEFIYSLLEHDLIEVKGSGDELRCEARPELSRAQSILPDTLQGLILARIDRLPPDHQFVLKVAAVIGRAFAYSPLQATLSRLIPNSTGSLEAQLNEIAQGNLIHLEALEPELTYLFKHIITQEVAYQTLLYNQRKEIHRAVAAWYEEQLNQAGGEAAQLDAARLLPLLVYHSNQAEDVERELRYARLAGEQAAQKYANTEAVKYLSRALELCPADDLTLQYELLLARQKVLNTQAARSEQARDLERLAILAEKLGDKARQAEVGLEKTLYQSQMGELEAAHETAQEVVRLAQAAGDVARQTEGHLRWGQALWRQARYAEARRQLEETLALAQAAGLFQIEASAYSHLGIVFDLSGDRDQAEAHFQRALELERQQGNRPKEANVLNNLGIINWRRGNLLEAQRYFEESLAIDREVGNRYNEGMVLGNLAMVMNSHGAYAKSRQYAEESLPIVEETGNRYGISRVLGIYGKATANLGEYAEALAISRKSLQHAREAGDRQDEVFQLSSLGYVLQQLGEQTAARESFELSLQLSQEIGDRDGEFAALSNLALLYHQLGEQAAAAEHGRRAIQIGEALSDPVQLSSAWTYLGHAQLGLGQAAEAEQSYRNALQLRESEPERGARLEIRAGLARAALAQERPDQAMAQVEVILPALTHNGLNGADERFQVYLTCYKVLQAGADPRSGQVLEAAYAQLQEGAARLSQDQRRTYLENIPAHREILRLGHESIL